MMKRPVDVEQNKENYLKFIEDRKTMIISMLDSEGQPFISNAPCIRNDGKFYIYISQIADHYNYIENSKYVDVLLIADESATNNKFATERARWKCVPKNIGNEGHEELFDKFKEQHGAATVNLLRTLDFSLFELTPLTGRYVVGFGMAFDVDVDGDRFIHVVVDKKKE